jgi:hypothetical protein
MNAILAEKEMSNVRFEIEQVESLAIDPHSGKFRLVVSEPGGETSLQGLRPSTTNSRAAFTEVSPASPARAV